MSPLVPGEQLLHLELELELKVGGGLRREVNGGQVHVEGALLGLLDGAADQGLVVEEEALLVEASKIVVDDFACRRNYVFFEVVALARVRRLPHIELAARVRAGESTGGPPTEVGSLHESRPKERALRPLLILGAHILSG